MSSDDRIYLDNAATSWPKPEGVYAAVDRYQRLLGAPVGRGTYSEAVEVEQAVEAARRGLARLLNAPHPRHIVFAFNGTDALNLAIHGLLEPGDHVVTSVVEHNSVLRPLRAWEEAGGISVSRVACDATGVVSPDEVAAALRPQTKLIALAHASNVTGALQPIAEVAVLAREQGATFLVDAAQTLGHVPIDVEALGIDLLASSGHKGLLGPLGTGLLYIRPGLEDRLRSTRQGGTGSRSDEDRQPDAMPDRFESGNHNALGLVGLNAALEFLAQRGIEAVRQQSERLTERLLGELAEVPGLRLYGPPSVKGRVGVVSLTLEGYDPQEVATTLEAAYRVQVRSGIQCAPLMHRALGTLEQGGTVRLSPGVFTTDAHITKAVAALAELAAAAHIE